MEVTSLPTRTFPEEGNNQFSPLLETLLKKRGITEEDEREQFLNPNYGRDTHDPFLFKDMDKAVRRILKGITDREKIILYTDYDTDGIPAGVLLHDFFKKIEYKNFENYIPHRNNEGYGLNKNAITQFAKGGATLMITADCGITDTEEVSYSQELGIDVILTDHHLPRRSSEKQEEIHDELPPAYVVLNPKREDNTYPFDMLCGAGVAFKLVQGLIERGNAEKVFTIPIGWEKWLLDMVGIATIADMVLLKGENRTLAYYGLEVLRKSPRPGLQALLRRAHTSQRYLTEEDVGFVIGPRINAASRIDTPSKAFELFAHKEEVFAGALAEELHNLNERRKGIVAAMLKEARMRLKKTELCEVIVLGNLNWHPGIVGLVAHRLADEHGRPVFVWGRSESGVIKGSCRSDKKVNIVELMNKTKELFLSFGGHEHSGGFSVLREKVHLLEEGLSCVYRSMEKKEATSNEWVDGSLTLNQVDWDTYRDIARLAPFGVGNPRPIFLFQDVLVERVLPFGARENHTTLLCKSESGRVISAISFFTSSREIEEKLQMNGRTTSFLAHIERNVFRERRELRLRVVGFK